MLFSKVTVIKTCQIQAYVGWGLRPSTLHVR
jgi:hypothetical protein